MRKNNVVNRKVIGVVFGGESVEHDISTITGVQIINALDKDKFEVIPIYITSNGRFITGKNLNSIKTFADNKETEDSFELDFSWKNKSLLKIKNKKQIFYKNIDFIFLALHGGQGEDGSLEGLLNTYKIPYSSSNVLGSSICMDKSITKLLCKSLDIPITKYVVLNEKDNKNIFNDIFTKLENLKFPLIVKPNSLGSSIGVTFCKNKIELKNAITFAFMFDSFVIVEEAISTLREFNISIMGNVFENEISDIEEVIIKNKFLTFENKYMSKNGKGMESSERIIPAKIEKNLEEVIKNYAKKFFEYTKLTGCVRVDFLLDCENQQVYFNEVNSIPGSLANYLWKNKRYTFSMLLEKIIYYSLKEDSILNEKIKRFSSSVLHKFDSKNKINFIK